MRHVAAAQPALTAESCSAHHRDQHWPQRRLFGASAMNMLAGLAA
jgi:hypothetical protein